ncbi:hypothetical protein HN858_04780 [Candidatus Falkowbacteria bacterium]|jgi:hypothetical protein|nr:hypothetical protein [Candidatus Falkowbacteria bacterium]MBT5502626.1 hypothetical protein [Candidatus Falkowbacteria bacterium]MBT6574435.1 hypothetical protein [Candidatus Falkowbacteria bacterium]MBT7348955.1 hypothetical protein [Candidatus Falkowbacteria bacterium]MBT7500318.1 hypothetical protein [Candidatus Falkowbacteria bacterium]
MCGNGNGCGSCIKFEVVGNRVNLAFRDKVIAIKRASILDSGVERELCDMLGVTVAFRCPRAQVDPEPTQEQISAIEADVEAKSGRF